MVLFFRVLPVLKFKFWFRKVLPVQNIFQLPIVYKKALKYCVDFPYFVISETENRLKLGKSTQINVFQGLFVNNWQLEDIWNRKYFLKSELKFQNRKYSENSTVKYQLMYFVRWLYIKYNIDKFETENEDFSTGLVYPLTFNFAFYQTISGLEFFYFFKVTI